MVRRSSLGTALAAATLLAAVSSRYYCSLLLIASSSSAVVVVSLQQSSSSAATCASRKRSIRHHHFCSPIITTTSSSTSLYSNNNTYSSEEEECRRGRKKRLEKLQKQRRRNRWMKRYGTVEALKHTFGTGPPWGVLSPTQTRSLYHTLLPRSLLALNEMGFVTAEDLAPLAYEARIAAKEYARSRCIWTGRVGVFLFDQYRSLRDKGRLIQPGKSSSMSWEEIWAKYEGQILKEHHAEKKKKKKTGGRIKELDEDELMMQTYMRILERSCSTNQSFDKLFLPDKEGGNGGGEGNGGISLASIASQLDYDVRTILLSPSEISKVEKKVKKMEKKQLKEREKEEKKQRKADRKKEKRRKVDELG